MKQIAIFTVLLLMITAFCIGQNKNAVKPKQKPGDKIEQYFFVMIKTGPKQDFDSAQKAGLFKGHMDNINKLYYQGILKVAGPFGKNDLAWRGIFVFDCYTK